MYKVLVIEDDTIMGDMLSMYLSEEGYSVKQAANGEDGLAILSEFEPHIVLLDLMLPDWDGMELCVEIRRSSNVPIMIVSMKTEVSERVHALKAGADDYLCKPFSMHELTARVYALIRRAQTMGAQRETVQVEETVPAAGELNQSRVKLDIDRRSLQVGGQSIETTFSEFEIMRLFLAHPGKVYSREDLINAIRGFDSFVTDRAIDVHIVNLRKKIEANPREPKYIRTVWGVGYKYMVSD
ncbi:response regulator transcription factor [Paenibacillus abyssi]|uniref:DNA-binding response regulator n=1 Tax=Paenibacillus abyssi TaxID=1340531 RepID=A0A917D097_9BACL|nr:response regulator transcription factor [Paenibacillus abyssi]GGG06767.1 DNA-binding response regulator [Paenibacillus abyssi]